MRGAARCRSAGIIGSGPAGRGRSRRVHVAAARHPDGESCAGKGLPRGASTIILAHTGLWQLPIRSPCRVGHIPVSHRLARRARQQVLCIHRPRPQSRPVAAQDCPRSGARQPRSVRPKSRHYTQPFSSVRHAQQHAAGSGSAALPAQLSQCRSDIYHAIAGALRPVDGFPIYTARPDTADQARRRDYEKKGGKHRRTD